jgi:hypothetical protein
METIDVEIIDGRTVLTVKDNARSRPRFIVAPNFSVGSFFLSQVLLPQWWQKAGTC